SPSCHVPSRRNPEQKPHLFINGSMVQTYASGKNNGAAGCSIPDKLLSSVDFPLPDLPTTARNSPGSTVKVTLFSTGTAPPADGNNLLTPRSSIRCWPLFSIDESHLFITYLLYDSLLLDDLCACARVPKGVQRITSQPGRTGCPPTYSEADCGSNQRRIQKRVGNANERRVCTPPGTPDSIPRIHAPLRPNLVGWRSK